MAQNSLVDFCNKAFSMSFASLLLVAGGDQIVSRSMNYGILALSACISIFIIAIGRSLINSNRKWTMRTLICIYVIMVIFVSAAYPLHGYSRDSYVSYTESYYSGSEFEMRHLPDAKIGEKKVFNLNLESKAMMTSAINHRDYENNKDRIISSYQYNLLYSNSNYEIALRSSRSLSS